MQLLHVLAVLVPGTAAFGYFLTDDTAGGGTIAVAPTPTPSHTSSPTYPGCAYNGVSLVYENAEHSVSCGHSSTTGQAYTTTVADASELFQGGEVCWNPSCSWCDGSASVEWRLTYDNHVHIASMHVSYDAGFTLTVTNNNDHMTYSTDCYETNGWGPSTCEVYLDSWGDDFQITISSTHTGWFWASDFNVRCTGVM